MGTVLDGPTAPVTRPPPVLASVPALPAGAEHVLSWRRQLMVLAALVACLMLYLAARLLAAQPALPGQWAADGEARLRLVATAQLQLQPAVGGTLVSAQGAGEAPWTPTAALLHTALRWQADPGWRVLQAEQRERLRATLLTGTVLLRFADGRTVAVDPAPRSYRGLGGAFWLLSALALGLALAGTVILLTRPHRSSWLYFSAASAQALQLALTAAETLPGLGLPLPPVLQDLPLRVSLDLLTLTATALGWRLASRSPGGRTAVGGRGRGALAWLLTLPLWLALCAVGAAQPRLGLPLWWLGQGLCLLLGAGLGLSLHRAARVQHNPHARVTWRLSLAVWLVLATATLVCATWPGVAPGSAWLAPNLGAAWHVAAALALLTSPALGRGRELARELMLLAGISAVASALDLLFVAVFSLGNFTSLALAVFLALTLYAGVRQWLLSRLLDQRVLSTERAFEALYRSAREVQRQPHAYPQALARLLDQVFSPLQVTASLQRPAQSEVLAGGSGLRVPLSPRRDAAGDTPQAWVLRFGDRGRRLFTPDDARLADRLLEQLDRAVAHDEAVERGRSEERQRIAQDLHDDIGARLLTLMYQAPTRELEDYIRHTLQDLKTLTRGLATPDQPLSHVAAEWKADLAQRLATAHAALDWDLEADDDPPLSVVQWSALTRVLRELVSNALFHGEAHRVSVALRLRSGQLDIVVSDDGRGRAPEGWSHGLGLGGVRKRVKLLGGHVNWREQAEGGIACRLHIPDFSLGPGHAWSTRPPG